MVPQLRLQCTEVKGVDLQILWQLKLISCYCYYNYLFAVLSAECPGCEVFQTVKGNVLFPTQNYLV